MKRHLLTILAFAALTASAQAPSLTTANQPTIGTSQTYYVADSNAANFDATVGANVTWDYSLLTGYSNTAVEQILDASTTAQASTFNTSTHADELQGNLTLFETVNTDSLMAQGYFFSEPSLGDVTAEFTNNEMKVMEYPFTFGDSYTDSINGTILVPAIIAIPFPYAGNVTVTADGYGTLLLGGSTYTDVLRIKTSEASIAQTGISGDIPVNRTQYFYYQPSTSNFPIMMHVTLDAAGTGASVVYSVENLVSVDELANSINVGVYPNPVADVLNIEVNAASPASTQLSIKNVLGQTVYSNSLNINIGKNVETIDMSTLKKGIYLVDIVAGKSRVTKKITKK